MQQRSRYQTARRILIFWTLFIGVGAVGGALLIVNGLTNLTAAALLLARKSAGVVLGGSFGVTLMLWIGIQFYMFPLNFMSAIYFIFGLCQAAAGQIREADYILVHHQKDTYENAAEEMDHLLGVTHTALRSIQCRTGIYKETSKGNDRMKKLLLLVTMLLALSLCACAAHTPGRDA